MLVWIQQFHWHKRGWMRHLKYCLERPTGAEAWGGSSQDFLLLCSFSKAMLPHQGHVVGCAAWPKPKAVGCGLALQLVFTGTAPMKPSFNSWSNSSFILAGGKLATGCSSQTHLIFVYFLHLDSASNPVLFPHDYFAAHFSLKSSLQRYFSEGVLPRSF